MRILAIALLVSGVAMAQGSPHGGGGKGTPAGAPQIITSSDSNSCAVSIPSMSHMCLNGSGGGAFWEFDGSNVSTSSPLVILGTITGTQVIQTVSNTQPQFQCFNTAACGFKAADGQNMVLQGVDIIDPAGKVTLPATDSSGTPGAATVNKPSGQASIAAVAGSVVITNSEVSATSVVMAVLQATDATCIAIKNVIPGSGTFTINVNAACTGNTKVGWVVFN